MATRNTDRAGAAWLMHACAVGGAVLLLASAVACRKDRSAIDDAPAKVGPDPVEVARQVVEAMTRTVASDPALEALNAVEELHAAIVGDALDPWRTGWLRGDAEALSSVVTEGATTPAFATSEPAVLRQYDGIIEYTWAPGPSEDAAAEGRGYLSATARLEDFRLDTFDLEPNEEGARLKVRFDLRAHLPDGRRRHDRGTLLIEAKRVENRWRLASVETDRFVRIENLGDRQPAFAAARSAVQPEKLALPRRLEAFRPGNDRPPPDHAPAGTGGDFDGDGLEDLVTTSGSSSTLERILRAAERAEIGAEKLDRLRGLAGGLRLYRNLGDGAFEEVSEKAGLTWPGDAPGDAAWIDYDNDGHLDLYVPNGLWSGGGEAVDSLYLRAALTEAPVDTTMLGTALQHFRGTLDGRREAADVPGLSLSGSQRNRLFRNNGDGTFTEVAFLERADRIEDGATVVAVDVNGDGRQDLFLGSTDPAPESSDGVSVLKNVYRGGNSLTVFAAGAGAPDGGGPVVTASFGDRKLTRSLRPGLGESQSEPAAFFGLGDADKVRKLEVYWPGGVRHVYWNVKAGRVRVKQGDAKPSASAQTE